MAPPLVVGHVWFLLVVGLARQPQRDGAMVLQRYGATVLGGPARARAAEARAPSGRSGALLCRQREERAMVGRMTIGATALLAITGAAWAQVGPGTSGAAGAAQQQGTTATPGTGATPAPGSPAVGSGSGASTGAGLGATGGLGGAGAPGAPGIGAATQGTVPATPAGGAKP